MKHDLLKTQDSMTGRLLPFTIVIEWENAVDVDDEWADRAVAGLERELEAVVSDVRQRPTVIYLFNSRIATVTAIERAIAHAAPRLREFADVQVIPTRGLSYYELKNLGAERAQTEITIFLDSDAAPQPGWLRGMVEPFNDPDIMAVGGITLLSHEAFLARTLALVWIFGLYEERERTARAWGIYANNTAVRTRFFKAHPFPRLDAFKYSCVFWLRSILAKGFRYVRVADAVTVHAPHPDLRFMLWRAWTTGLDRDFYVSQNRTPFRLDRAFRAITFFLARSVRGWWRILTKGHLVGLPIWQVPPAMIVAFAYSVALFAGQMSSVVRVSAAERRVTRIPREA
jgi:hypothetical protein